MAVNHRSSDRYHCVYCHYRKSDSVPYYIGISGNRRRPYDFESRTQLHKNITKKHGAIVKILAEGLTFEEAVVIEAEMIQTIGRIYDNTGPLANFCANHHEHYKARNKPNKRINASKKVITPKKAKKARKQPQKASNVESVVLMMSSQYSIRQIAKKLSIPTSKVREIIS